MLADARKLLETAAAEPEKGPRLTAQVEQLGALIAVATQPVPVRLESDQLTSVTLYRVGTLGAFTAKDVELRPALTPLSAAAMATATCARPLPFAPAGTYSPISVVCVEPI